MRGFGGLIPQYVSNRTPANLSSNLPMGLVAAMALKLSFFIMRDSHELSSKA